ncbi:MAG TPA: serine/threonine-protein kinase [Blastocatellia bacterium]|nr:serine/threonine-protein kinase [Blastocatellia bacterium]
MNPERWRHIEELFRTVVDRPEAERDTYLTRVCDGDEELRREVLSLLERDTAEDFIRDPIASAVMAYSAELKVDLTGERIGPYRITRLVGRGGMGDVYEAERDDEQFRQRVAIKIIKHGMDTDFVRDRFLRERQILASLDHPHIARLFDGGATPDGLPYFVMEFVAGEPIMAYCRRHHLSVNEKLKLFLKVCSAVQHAHQKLVVHRDLKPSNILITESGEPKLLDFGIAKLLLPDGSQPQTRTETALLSMTPEYASPEQARGRAVATTTDVYSLGVVLYELLSERRPYEFKTYSPAEIERVICDTEVEEPSKVVGRMTDAPARLSRQLAGDLDNIALMAMRKEPERRYQSVEQFSEDIRRHLAGMPVVARKDTFVYRVGKFARRHKAGVAILALIAILAVAMTVQAARIAKERDRANQEAAAAQAVTQSLVAMFEVADPAKARGNVITARELLDQGAEKVVQELKGQPAVQAKLLDTIGQLYQSIGLYDREKPLLEKALKLRREALGEDHPDVASSLNHLGEVERLKGDFVGSESLFCEALAARLRLFGAESKEVAETLNYLALLLHERGQYDEAERLHQDALEMRRKLLGPEHLDIAISLNNLGSTLHAKGRFDEAERKFRESLEMRRKLFGSDHIQVAVGMINLAGWLHRKGRLEEAESLSRDALEIRRRWLGEDHPETILILVGLASILRDKGDCRAALPMYEEGIRRATALLGPDHLDVAGHKMSYGPCLTKLGRYRDAEEQLLTAHTRLQTVLGQQHWRTKLSLRRLVELYEAWGKPTQAEAYRALLQTDPNKPRN